LFEVIELREKEKKKKVTKFSSWNSKELKDVGFVLYRFTPLSTGIWGKGRVVRQLGQNFRKKNS